MLLYKGALKKRPMDLPALTKLLDYGLLGLLLVISIFAIISLYKKIMEIQDARVKDSTEREKTVTIALNSVTQNMQTTESTLKAILITLEKNNGKN